MAPRGREVAVRVLGAAIDAAIHVVVAEMP
jgi:hypothetical protein